MEKKLTLGSLFDGSGGFPLGGLLAGITPVWASEIEPFPIRVTTKRLPFMKHYGNISAMDGSKIEPVDIISFGSPCQDMSVAGRRDGLDGSRSSLFYEAVRIIKEMRCATNGKYPRYIVWENVPGAFSSNKGEDFKAVLEAVIGIAEPNAEVPVPEKARWPYADLYMGDGWSVAYRTLDAQYWGVPQRRRRIYLVADFAGRSAGKILFESEGLSGYSAEGFRSWKRVAGSFTPCAGAAGFDGYNGSLTDDTFSTLSVNCGMLRAGTVSAAVYENHSQDTRYTEPLDVAPTVSSTYGTGGNNQPFVVSDDAPYTMKIRSGCEGGGKGALIQENKSATLSCNNDQTLFEPCGWDGGQISPTLTKQNAGGNQRMPDKDNFTCVLQPFGICSKDSNAMKSDNPHSGIYEAETARTLDGNGGNPSCNQGGIAVVAFTQNQRDEVRDLGDRSAVVCANAGTKQQTYVLQGSMIGREDRNDPQGDGINEDVSFTLNTADRHAVCYGIGRDAFNQGQDAKFSPTFEEELQPPLVAKGPGAIQCGYAVRCLTPTECARLQGFPDNWCADLGTEKPTDDEMHFWRKVFKTYSEVTGCKMKSDKQIAKWLKNPYSDSAEYKMWGNGVALPCVWFVLCGIVWASKLF